MISRGAIHPFKSFIFCLSTTDGVSDITEQMVLRSGNVQSVATLFHHLKCTFMWPRVQEKSLDAISQTNTNYILQGGIITYTITFAFHFFPEIWGNYAFTVRQFSQMISQRCPVVCCLAQWDATVMLTVTLFNVNISVYASDQMLLGFVQYINTVLGICEHCSLWPLYSQNATLQWWKKYSDPLKHYHHLVHYR